MSTSIGGRQRFSLPGLVRNPLQYGSQIAPTMTNFAASGHALISTDGRDTAFSTYLHLLRALAALAVYLFHAKYFAGVAVPLLSDYGSQAVIVFFVLSGLLIAYSADRYSDLVTYGAARLGRLWSVVLPAMALTFVLDTLGQAIDLGSYAPMQPFGIGKWLAAGAITGLFLNQAWNFSIFVGTNGPFWSLSYEFWYYALFGVIYYLAGVRRLVAVALCALIAGPKILIAMPVWAMGIGVFRLLRCAPRVSPAVGMSMWLLSFGLAALFAAFQLHERLTAAFPEVAATAARHWAINFWPSSYLIGLVISLNLFGFACTGNTFDRAFAWFADGVRTLADLSFGLYLFHYPLMYFVRACATRAHLRDGPLYIVLIYGVPLVVSAIVAIWCERNKRLFSRAILSGLDLLGYRTGRATGPAETMHGAAEPATSVPLAVRQRRKA